MDKLKIYKKCNECNKRIITLSKSVQVCQTCYKTNGGEFIDSLIRQTQINHDHKKEGKGARNFIFNFQNPFSKMKVFKTSKTENYYNNLQFEFIPYDKFTNIKYIAAGGFSQIYKATWPNCQISELDFKSEQSEFEDDLEPKQPDYEVVLKKLNNSKRITSKELNELKIFYQLASNTNNETNIGTNVSKYLGITQDPDTRDIIIIMRYYNSGDLITYLNDNFYNFRWVTKLNSIKMIVDGLIELHSVNIIHRDLHSGKILFNRRKYEYASVVISDLGISKSATESAENNNENYGIIPYMAPEIFRGQKYTTASDIYSFGMIMWEFMTGRRPFWNETHDTELIIRILDGLRPPIVTNAPEGYIELMKECWHSDPNKRPKATDIRDKICIMHMTEHENNCDNPTEVISSQDIGPLTIYNPGAVYKSRPLSDMIQSAMSIKGSRSKSLNLETDPFYYYQKNNASTDKIKFENNLTEINNDNDYSTKEIELDINNHNNKYNSREFEFDINTL